MSNLTLSSLENYMNNLTLDMLDDKMNEFLRFNNRNDYFTESDSKEYIEKSFNIWAGCAYLVLVKKFNNEVLTTLEKSFFDQYYNNYLKYSTNMTSLENDLLKAYIKFKLSKDFQGNQTLDKNMIPFRNPQTNEILPQYYLGLDEYAKTLNSILNLTFQKNISFNYNHNLINNFDEIRYNNKTDILTLSDRFIEDNYLEFMRSNCDFNVTLKAINKLFNAIEYSYKADIKKNDKNFKALTYTIEDYLYSKASKNTKVGKNYRDLYDNVISRKAIDLDTASEAIKDLVKFQGMMLSTTKDENEKKRIKNDFDFYINDLENALHYIPNAEYLDTNNLDKDAFILLFNLYINGLKSKPKSNLSPITKYFALNGNALPIVDMNLQKEKLNAKLARLNKKLPKEEFEVEKAKVEEIINTVETVKNIIPSYQIEQKALNILNTRYKDDEQFNQEFNYLIDMCLDNINAFNDFKYRIECMYNQLDNLAGSDSPSKVQEIKYKKRVYLEELKVIEVIENHLNIIQRENQQAGIDLVDSNKDVVFSKVNNEVRVLSALQNILGRGILTCQEIIEDATKNNKPILKDLKPGYKKFVENYLAICGVKELNPKTKTSNNKK